MVGRCATFSSDEWNLVHFVPCVQITALGPHIPNCYISSVEERLYHQLHTSTSRCLPRQMKHHLIGQPTRQPPPLFIPTL